MFIVNKETLFKQFAELENAIYLVRDTPNVTRTDKTQDKFFTSPSPYFNVWFAKPDELIMNKLSEDFGDEGYKLWCEYKLTHSPTILEDDEKSYFESQIVKSESLLPV